MFMFTFAAFSAMGADNKFTLSITNEKYFFYIFWGMANGPFAISVILLRNALVLHDLQKISECFIHLSPVTLAWTFRWFAPQVLMAFPGIFDLPEPTDYSATFLDIFLPGLYFYAVWWVLFIVYTLVYARYQGTPYSKYETCYILHVNDKPWFKKMIGYDGSTLETHARMGPFMIYFTMHLVGTLSLIALSYVFWNYFWAHTALVLLLFFWATWNGAQRYFNMMTKYYIKAI